MRYKDKKDKKETKKRKKKKNRFSCIYHPIYQSSVKKDMELALWSQRPALCFYCIIKFLSKFASCFFSCSVFRIISYLQMVYTSASLLRFCLRDNKMNETVHFVGKLFGQRCNRWMKCKISVKLASGMKKPYVCSLKHVRRILIDGISDVQ
ncbi:hypothetical protein J1N35_007570 [Gossypium stocksii]|uniref:Uncharacterized protein n=1 Tax=Gossypium stocksii TaxID=47602 RepID=A0A9D4ADL3_9ROSI|nr:hypothetical protein J1N35_007570 [Gossypium stocksii]